MSARRVVVLGYGMAGARLAEEIRRRDPDGTRVALTIVGAERHHAYNRVLLSAVLAGSLSTEAVRLHEPDWAKRRGIDLRLGVSAVGLDRRHRRVRLSDGTAVPYDSLVLATGSTPWIPPVEGLATDTIGGECPAPVTFRTLDDCAHIIATARAGAPVAVLGGGLLGLEAARGLASRGSMVTVVHPGDHVLNGRLDPAAGAVLARTLAEAGVDFRLGRTAARYLPGDGLKLDDGSHVEAELVVVSAGVRPATELADAAGIAVDGGVLVDDALRTSDGRVHAIGDCARHPGTESGLVQPAWEQAEVLADLLTGTDAAARYRGTAVVTRLKAEGVELAVLGRTHVAPDDPEFEVVCLHDPVRGRYGKLVLRENRVVGAILLGLPDAAATITQLYDRRGEAPADRLALLLGRALPAAGTAVDTAAGTPADLPASAVVCRCNTVSKGALVQAWHAGACGADELVSATRAGTGCGGCVGTVRGLADWLASTT